ncbi:MAG: Fe-Mn family superoxide dismutase [Polyangia bacterium]
MAHSPKNFDQLISECAGFLSENQLKAHFTLYQGYVKKLNEIEEKLATADRGTANYSFGDYSELRRREPVAYNGTVLHELYFQNLGAAGGEPSAAFKRAVEASFGSWDTWIADVKAIVGSGHGWCLVSYDWNFNKVRNTFVQSEHHVGLLPNQSILVAVDAWEHAYFMDYGTKKPDYLAGVLKHLNYGAIEQRLANTPAGQGKAS